jgi:hypothetical protein
LLLQHMPCMVAGEARSWELSLSPQNWHSACFDCQSLTN